MKRYIIEDNERGSFGSWSYDHPPNEAEIINHFKILSDDEGLGGDELIPHEAFNLNMISDIWNVSFIPVEDHIKALEAELTNLSKFSNGYRSIVEQLDILKGAI